MIFENNLDWTKCVGVRIDGARSMSSSYEGLEGFVRSKTLMMWTHCFIRVEELAPKHLSPALHQVLECAMNIVDFINTRPLKVRFSKKLCEDMTFFDVK